MVISAVAQNPKFAPVRTDIPMGGKLSPKQEEPVFANCSKQGMRVLVSRDDGKNWKQTFLATDSGKTVAGTVTTQFTAWLTPRV